MLDRQLRDFIAEVASRTAAPGGGSVAALAVALGAGLAEMAARFSVDAWDGAERAVAQAAALRQRAEPLAQRDADAYAALLAARRASRDGREAGAGAAGAALEEAALVPLEIAAVAAEVAALAAEVARLGNPNLRGDAACAAALAEAAARAAANLVVINLGSSSGDGRIARANALAAAASASAREALEPYP